MSAAAVAAAPPPPAEALCTRLGTRTAAVPRPRRLLAVRVRVHRLLLD